MKKYLPFVLIIAFAFILGLPSLTSAQSQFPGSIGSSTTFITQNSAPASTSSNACSSLPNGAKFQDIICYVVYIIQNYVITLIFALAIVVFVWGVVQFFIIGAGEEAKRAQGRQLMIWGIIGLVVMMGVWSLAKIVGNTFGLETTLPKVSP